MAILDALRRFPEPIKKPLRPIASHLLSKNNSELSFWKRRHEIEGGRFDHSEYERLMLAMAEEASDEFLRGKVVADFGCGPLGTLEWCRSAQLRIGIDVLADQYADSFTSDIISHSMIYLKATEKVIPLPSGLVDVMYTLNAVDHVKHLSTMCDEILRVLKSGGEFIGSFNLEEPPSPCEPQRLSEKLIDEVLLSKLQTTSYRVTELCPLDKYSPFFSGEKLTYRNGREGVLWVRAKKP